MSRRRRVQAEADLRHFRWTWNGGREVTESADLVPDEVIVTGKGHVSHSSLDCEALKAGQLKARQEGHPTSPTYAVSRRVAMRYVRQCSQCFHAHGPGPAR